MSSARSSALIPGGKENCPAELLRDHVGKPREDIGPAVDGRGRGDDAATELSSCDA